MKNIIVHQVDITHFRLVELSLLADQSKPFYDWVERTAKKITGSHKDLNNILMSVNKDELRKIIIDCYQEAEEKRPLLFDGIGRVYHHGKACFFFFSWMIRDAPQQRLAPLIARMRRTTSITKRNAEVDTLVELILEYRSYVKSFDWITVREVIVDRLEGSRRSIRGHELEASVRTALITAFQNYYSIYGNYGKYKSIEVLPSQIKVESYTFDVAVKLTHINKKESELILIPIKTRETEGGGHSHLFTRDIMSAFQSLKRDKIEYYVIAVIIAKNWSDSELENIRSQINKLYHFDLNPNSFINFDETSQIDLNRYIHGILTHE